MLSPGDRLGPYEVVSALGAGGMGEVYRARDSRLGRDVALKVLPEGVASEPDRLKRFEREARATAALSHVNVLTVFDVGTDDGRAFVVTEILDGTTLGARLRRGALPVREALSLAAQAARGLAAAHAKGIVHRDLKPENLFLTTSGTLKILDFGLARLGTRDLARTADTTESNPTGPGSVLGTVNYMSPEQAKGLLVDTRSDLFSLGVVLHEMLSGRHPFKRTSSAETVSAILRDEPPDLGALEGRVPGAVEGLVKRCLEKRPDDRFQTASDLALAVDLLARGEDAESHRSSGKGVVADANAADERPYPGLSSFTEADAAHFFGREDEVRALWEKIRRQKLLAVIGPSGVGKTSFLRAGVLAHKPTGWAAVYTTPGADPALALAQALSPQLAGDAEAITALLRGVPAMSRGAEPLDLLDAFGRWRARHGDVLLVVDQAEELFTQNRPEIQAGVATLIGRLADAGIHVLVSLRDDFLFRCAEHSALGPVFRDLTPLPPPSPEALRRALVEPAARQGVRFEDPTLVDEMVGAVAGERAALPLLAFAASRLWDERDHERQQLTRQAHDRIGGVAGALAQHAEATLERIGAERIPLVRELVRNLVTAQGTRAVREREELLSVFEASGKGGAAQAWTRSDAEAVLLALVNARLLTAYERASESGESRQHVEIVHESLLASWPRLVRWQTQDKDGAQLRDQVRQASELWHERGRSQDLLWSGSAYREYAVWRERYSGGLSTLEEDFARAMERSVTRQRRRRRAVVAALLAAATSVTIVTSVLWQRADTARRKAEAEVRQREAAQLLALGRGRLEDDATGALAYALASLERADNEPARRFAVEALWKGPPARYISAPAGAVQVAFSPDGRWLAGSHRAGTWLLSQDGGERREIAASQALTGWSGDGQLLVTRAETGRVHVVSAPEGKGVRTLDVGSLHSVNTYVRGLDLITLPTERPSRSAARRIPLVKGDGVEIGRVDRQGLDDFVLQGDWFMELRRGNLQARPLDALSTPPRTIGRHEGAVGIWDDGVGNRLASITAAGEVWIWAVTAETRWPGRVLPAPLGDSVSLTLESSSVGFDPSGRSLVVATAADSRVWDLSGAPNAEPISLSDRLGPPNPWRPSISRDWVAFPRADYAVLWPLRFPQASVLRRPAGSGRTALAFTADGRRLVSHSAGEGVRVWPLLPEEGLASRLVYQARWLNGNTLDVDSSGRFAVAPEGAAGVAVVPLEGGQSRLLEGDGILYHARLDRENRRVAAYGDWNNTKPQSVPHVYVWDLATSQRTTLDAGQPEDDCAAGGAMQGSIWGLEFPRDGSLWTDGFAGLRRWDNASRTSELLRPCDPRSYRGVLDAWHTFVLSRDERVGVRVFSWPSDPMAPSIVSVLDLTAGRDYAIARHGNRVHQAALDATGRILVTGDRDGVVRVGPVTGEEPHLLYGHTAEVTDVTFSSDGKWIASASLDGTIRLWPMPASPPLHTLPYETLLAKLRALTNLRVVADASARDGYKLEIGPFPGWAKEPAW